MKVLYGKWETLNQVMRVSTWTVREITKIMCLRGECKVFYLLRYSIALRIISLSYL